tara:strand:+ start:625 stop:1098 length:474 start_codon:yes stop_codon:yes gene_type:complete
MKKTIKVNFFSDSKKWPRRMPKIKEITQKTIRTMHSYFHKDYPIILNLILSHKKRVKKLNEKYKKKATDTDVLTFVTQTTNKNLGKLLYCDIFFSIDTIESFVKTKKLTIYDHFNHLLIHSILHINGYDHKNLNQFNKMKKEEIKIINKFGLKNPYI